MKLPKKGLPPGYRVALVADVPQNHRVPGFKYVVMGPAWGGGTGEGSFGSGQTPAQAVRRARKFIRRES